MPLIQTLSSLDVTIYSFILGESIKLSFFQCMHVQDEWVVCRIFHKSTGIKKGPIPTSLERIHSIGDDILLDSTTLPPLIEHPLLFSENQNQNQNNHSGMSNIPTPSSSFPYFSNMLSMDNQQANNLTQNPVFYPINMPPSDPYFSLPTDNLDYLQCKKEHQSNFTRSQDTGLSTDRNTEISSVLSRHYDDLDGPSSSVVDTTIDLESMWKY